MLSLDSITTSFAPPEWPWMRAQDATHDDDGESGIINQSQQVHLPGGSLRTPGEMALAFYR